MLVGVILTRNEGVYDPFIWYSADNLRNKRFRVWLSMFLAAQKLCSPTFLRSQKYRNLPRKHLLYVGYRPRA